MLEELDKHISDLTESVARMMNRRQLLGRGVKGIFAAAAGIALAEFTNIKNVFATTCTCNWAGGSGNANCPKSQSGCIGTGCPNGYSVCTSNSGCGPVCDYLGGRWISCTGLCTNKHGYRICTDCNSPGCSDVCTCLSPVICCLCTTTKEVEEEMRRLGIAYAH